MKTFGLLTGSLIVLLGTSPSASPRAGAWLSVQAPAVMLAPGHLVVQTIVEPDRDNRAIQVIAESSESYQSSEVELDGEAAPRRNTFEFKDLPNGTYEIHAMLFGSGREQRALVVRKLVVISHVH